ncbi:hypothetical protein Peur_011327 [Populus x canadensis]
MVGEPWLCYRGDSKHGSTSYGHHPAQPHMKTKPSCFHRTLMIHSTNNFSLWGPRGGDMHLNTQSDDTGKKMDPYVCKCFKAMCIGR